MPASKLDARFCEVMDAAPCGDYFLSDPEER